MKEAHIRAALDCALISEDELAGTPCISLFASCQSSENEMAELMASEEKMESLRDTFPQWEDDEDVDKWVE